MTNLSPAAQRVYNAVLEICPAPADEIAAAALRAAAVYCTRERRILMTIADELEGVTYGTYRCELEAVPNSGVL
jgi:hypothetical protein